MKSSLFSVNRKQRPAAGLVVVVVAALTLSLLAGLVPTHHARAGGGLDLVTPPFNPQGLSHASLAWGDYDDDGDLDLLAAGLQGGSPSMPFTEVYQNDGSGNLSPVSAGLVGVFDGAVAWVDFDPNDQGGRNYLDALVVGAAAGSENYQAHLYLYDGTGFVDFGITLHGLYGGSASWGDYDSDGDMDLLLTGEDADTSAQTTLLYANELVDPANPAFGRTLTLVSDSRNPGLTLGLEGYGYSDSQWCDFNQDGRVELLITGSTLSPAGPKTTIYRWDAELGRFVDTGAMLPGLLTSSAACGDFDADGDPDLLLAGASGANFSAQTLIYRNTNPGWQVFASSPPVPGDTDLKGAIFASVAWGDVNDDGLLDALVTGRRGQFDETTLYYNQVDQGSGAHFFIPATDLALSQVSRAGIAFGDANGDGDLDLALSGQSGVLKKAELYLNPRDLVNPETDNAFPVLSLAEARVSVTASSPGFNEANLFVVANPFAGEETPSAGITYRLKLWSMAGADPVYLVRPPDPNSGLGLSSMQLGGFVVSGLVHGETYEWSVQAVDASYAASEWSEPVSFVANAMPNTVLDQLVVDEDGDPGQVNVLENDYDLDFDGDVPDSVSLVPGSLVRTTIDPPAGALFTLSDDGTFTYQSPPDINQDETFTYLVQDNHGAQAAGEIRVIVNPTPDPTTTNDVEETIDEDRSDTLLLTLAASDPDTIGPKGSPLVFSVVDGPARGSLNAPSDGAWSYSVFPDYSGTDIIHFRVSAGEGDEATGTITINITPTNDAPRAPVPALSFEILSGLTLQAQVTAYDPDGDPVLNENPVDQPLTYSLFSDATHPLPSLGTIPSFTSGGAFTYQAGMDYGLDHFYFLANDGLVNSQPVEVAVNVVRINQLPVAVDQVFDALNQPQPVEDTIFSQPLAVTDPDGDLPLSFDLLTPPQHGQVSINETGPGQYAFVYQPENDYFGPDSFVYQAVDTRGGADTAQVTLDLLAVDDAPFFTVSGSLPGIDEDTFFTGVITASQPANEPGDGVALAAQVQPVRGTLDFNPLNGEFTYTPNPDHNGQDTFTIRASQPGSSLFTDQEFQIMVRQVNDAPAASGLLFEIDEDSGENTGSVTIIDIDNDPQKNQDPDGPGLQILTVTLLSRPIRTQNINTFQLVQNLDNPEQWDYIYHPIPNFYGSDSFTFTVSDGQVATSPVMSLVEVANVNDLPLTVIDFFTVFEDSTNTNPENCKDVVANDLDPNFTYPDPDIPLVTHISQPQHGSAEIINGLVCYTPDANYFGGDTFQYTLTDGPYSPQGDVVVTVTSVPDDPELAPIGNQTAAPGVNLSFTVNATDGDPGDQLAYTAVYLVGGAVQSSLPTGAAFNPVTRVFSWTPSVSQVSSTPYTFRFTVTDSTLRQDMETIQVTVIASGNVRLSGNAMPDPVTAGDPLEYMLLVENIGASTVNGVVLTATLPQGVVFNSSRSSAACSASGQTVTCTRASLVSGSTVSFTVVVDVDSALADGSLLVFSADVVIDELELDDSNNHYETTTQVVRKPPEPENKPIFLPMIFSGG